MLRKVQSVPSRTPRRAWSGLAVLFGAVFGYAASVAWGDDAKDNTVRGAVVVYSVLFAESVRCGIGWNAVGRGIGRLWDWLGEKRLIEAGVVILMVWAFGAVFGSVMNTGVGGGKKVEAAMSAAEKCGTAVRAYTQDYDETLPPHTQTGTIQHYLRPYVRREGGEDVFVDPISDRAFTWRRCMSGLFIGDIEQASMTVLAYSPVASDGKRLRATIFLDGYVSRRSDYKTAFYSFPKAFAMEPLHAPKKKAQKP